jgi:putative transcriptional regulator
MQISHHPDDATLMSFSAGSIPEALSVVVASHIALCPSCAKEVERMDALGAILMGALEPVKMVQAVPSVASAKAGLSTSDKRSSRGTNTDLPGPLSRIVGTDLADIPWKRLGLGVWHLPLPLSEDAEGDLRLLKVGPGRVMPEHGHGASELTLILDGAYSDKYGEFKRGDLADLDDSVEHRPIANASQGCICLVASERRAKFKTLIGRIAQPLTGL